MAESKTTTPLPRTVLSLETVLPTLIIRINGDPYELARGEELSIRQHAHFERLRDRMQTIREGIDPLTGDMSEADEAEMADVLKLMCGIVLRAPADVQATLKDPQRMQIVGVFLAPPPPSKEPEAPAATEKGAPADPAASTEKTAGPSNGSSSSRDSLGSTQAP